MTVFGKNRTIGESSMNNLLDSSRTADIIANEDTKCLVIWKSDYDSIVKVSHNK
jgi:hypothetical protein